MMEKYSKPMVTVDQGLAEGVYADSGAGCYKASAYIHQTPGIGRGDYRIQVNGQHHADHTKEAQTLTISFNQPVTYSSSNGTLAGATTGTTLTINYTYHQFSSFTLFSTIKSIKARTLEGILTRDET